MAEHLPQKFGAATPNIGDQLRHKLARRLTAPLTLPSWGPVMLGDPAGRRSWRQTFLKAVEKTLGSEVELRYNSRSSESDLSFFPGGVYKSWVVMRAGRRRWCLHAGLPDSDEWPPDANR